ncbi:MAG: F0F1 ATP synthase subunit A [Syntrophomonas sp.]|nr:F0F1 ATP synthase subunit A [Syntrophomonas sp.]
MIFGMWDAVYFKLGPIPVDHIIVTQWVLIVLIGLIAFCSTRKMKVIPTGLQNAFEMIIVWTYDLFGQIMSKEHVAKRWTPLLSTFFLFILVSNYSGMIPGSSHIEGFQAPTSNWNVTMTLALITVFAVQIAGLSEHGIGGYLKHFVSPMPAMLPINILEEFTHPLSLTVRLFGNVLGEEMVIAFLMFMVPFLIPCTIMALGVLVGAIQAMVFALLSASYIASATSAGH